MWWGAYAHQSPLAAQALCPTNPRALKAFPATEGLGYSQGCLSHGFQPWFQSGHPKGCLAWLKAAGMRLQRSGQGGGGRGLPGLVMHLSPTCRTSSTHPPPPCKDGLSIKVLRQPPGITPCQKLVGPATTLSVKCNPFSQAHEAFCQLASASLYGLLAFLASPSPQHSNHTKLCVSPTPLRAWL